MTIVKKGGLILAAIALVAVVTHLVRARAAYRERISELASSLATRDRTVETQKGLYERVTAEVDDLRSLLDTRDDQVRAMSKEIEDRGDRVLSVSKTVVRWKAPLEGSGEGRQEDVAPVDGRPARTRVDFSRDFGYVKVDGHTLTNPAEYSLRLSQGRPLSISLAVVQGKDGGWRTYATSSEDNVAVDIEVSAVDPLVLSPRWYESIGLSLSGGSDGSSVLAGVGVSYRFGSFEAGPTAWVLTGDGSSVLYGASLTWSPFKAR